MSRRIELYSDHKLNPESQMQFPVTDIFSDVNDTERFARPDIHIFERFAAEFRKAGQEIVEPDFEHCFDYIIEDLEAARQSKNSSTPKSIVIDLDTIEQKQLKNLRAALSKTYGQGRAQKFGIDLSFYYASADPKKLNRLPRYVQPFPLDEAATSGENLNSVLEALLNGTPIPEIVSTQDNVVSASFGDGQNPP